MSVAAAVLVQLVGLMILFYSGVAVSNAEVTKDIETLQQTQAELKASLSKKADQKDVDDLDEDIKYIRGRVDEMFSLLHGLNGGSR
jgi:peptidoglycan hydrolase CwlO-like protein